MFTLLVSFLTSELLTVNLIGFETNQVFLKKFKNISLKFLNLLLLRLNFFFHFQTNKKKIPIF